MTAAAAAAGAPRNLLKRHLEDENSIGFTAKKAREQKDGLAAMSDAPLSRALSVARPAAISYSDNRVVPLQESARKCQVLMWRYEEAKAELAAIARPYLHIESFKQIHATILEDADEKILKAMEIITGNGNDPKVMQELCLGLVFEFAKTKSMYRIYIELLRERYLLNTAKI